MGRDRILYDFVDEARLKTLIALKAWGLLGKVLTLHIVLSLSPIVCATKASVIEKGAKDVI